MSSWTSQADLYEDAVNERFEGTEYHPLVIEKLDPVGDGYNAKTRLKFHKQQDRDHYFDELSKDCIINQQQQRRTKLLACITGYNEPYRQLLESVAGVYRGYAELLEKDESYKDMVSIVIVYDGKEPFLKVNADKPNSLAQSLTKVGLYREQSTSAYYNICEVNEEEVKTYSDLSFLSKEYSKLHSNLKLY